MLYHSQAETTGNTYYVSPTGNDSNPGTETSPWNTVEKAVRTVVAGDTIFIRGGEYTVPQYGWQFQKSGASGSPVTLTNYPSEAVTLKITVADGRDAFYCGYAYGYSPKADYIRIIGTNVAERTLSNNVQSVKGIVIQGLSDGTTGGGFSVANCNNWEISGLDFVDNDVAIWLLKTNNSSGFKSTTNWYVHDNRVYGFFAESGMQSNGDYNTFENNEIYKVKPSTVTPWGCQHINITGHHNIVKNNILSPLGGQASCYGILLEWDLADYNIIESNRIYDTWGVDIAGGDNNIIRNNVIYRTAPVQGDWTGAIHIQTYDNQTAWPCDDDQWLGTTFPPNDPSNPDYQYYYNPRNCHSYGNQIYNNTIANFDIGLRWNNIVPEQTIIRNNAFYGWIRGGVCNINGSTGKCDLLPASLTADHNFEQGSFGFVNPASFDFHLTTSSPLIDAGYNLGSLVANDFDNITRPQGSGYDIGAFEYQSGNNVSPTPITTQTPTPVPQSTPTPTPKPTSTPTPKPTSTPTLPSPTLTSSPISPANTITVSSIGMGYKITGSKYTISATVYVVNQSTSAVIPSANVSVSLKSPSGTIYYNQNKLTNSNGRAAFSFKTTEKGVYTLTVTKVSKTGYLYNPIYTTVILTVK